MPRLIRAAVGSYSNCAKLCRFPALIDTLLFDRDDKFGWDVIEFLKASSVKPIRIAIRSPWQNGVAERWVGSCRREMLDHVIPLNEQPLRHSCTKTWLTTMKTEPTSDWTSRHRH